MSKKVKSALALLRHRAEGGSVFDPRGSDYDYATARSAGLGPDSTGHWPSRDPRSGVLLKGTSHPTWQKTLDGESAAGMEVYKRDGRMYSRPRRADGGEVDDTSVRREDVPAKPWLPHVEFRPTIEDRSPQDRPVLKGPLDSIVAHAVDLARTPGYVSEGKFQHKPAVPGQWSDEDEATQQIYEQSMAKRGWEMGLNMVGMPGLTGGMPGLGSGAARMARNPLADPERMSIATEEAVRKRGQGIPTGTDAAGWNFKRPDPTGFRRDAAEARSGFRADAGDARESFSRDTNPLMRPDDWAEMERPGFVLGSGSRDKRVGAATTAADARLAEQEAPGYLKSERNGNAGPGAATPEPAFPGDGGGGLGGGNRSVAEAEAAATRIAAGAEPLAGLPRKPLIVGEDHYVPGPIGQVRQIAEDYMKGTGRPYAPPDRYYPIDKGHSSNIAKAFEEMKHAPNDPAVKQSYDALIDETVAQFKAMEKAGLKIEFIKPGQADPYAATPRPAARDVADNNHLWVFPTDSGFGTLNAVKDNPMLRPTDITVDGRKLLANDVFRIVHDYFGHLKEGHGFRAAGEDNAWRAHSSMYSDIARPAMTTETRGQNSNVNFSGVPLYKAVGEARARELHGDAGRKSGDARGVQAGAVDSPEQVRMDRGAGADNAQGAPRWQTITVGEHNRTANAADTIYADQKVGIMPEWTMRDAGSQAPIVAHHGTPHKFDKFDLQKVGTGEGEEVYGHGLYFAESPKVAKHYRDILTKPENQPLLLHGRPVDQMWNDGIRQTWADEIKKLPKRDREDFVDILSTLSQIQKPSHAHHVTDGFNPQQMKLYKEKIEPHLAASPRNKGSLYDVALDVDPRQLLDWDRIFKEQSPHVRKSLMDDLVKLQAERQQAQAKLLERGPKTTSFTGRPLSPLSRAREEMNHQAMRERAGKTPEQIADELSGKDAYKQMGLPAATQEQGYRQASAALKERGVPGLKYRDQGSRVSDVYQTNNGWRVSVGDKSYGPFKTPEAARAAADKKPGTSNYVMFDDSLVRILKRYGIMLPGGGVAAQFMREQEPEARASGGAVNDALRLIGKMKRRKGVHIGPIISSVAGRTDHHPMSVPAGSYVLPADHVSSLGEGNTISGMEVVNKMFDMGPYETRSSRAKRAAGGSVDKPIEIVAAGGEVVIPPEKLAERFGDLDSGHSALDAWVVENRKHHIKTLSELPGPAQD